MAICYTTCPTYGAGELANLTSMITSCNDAFAVLAVRMGLHVHLNHNMNKTNVLALKEFFRLQDLNGHLYPHEYVRNFEFLAGMIF
jgi:pyridoxine 5'-phosphate synthase PdxJ